MSNKIQFEQFNLNIEQTHITANQLYHTIAEFKGTNIFDNRDHIIGKLKFFIDAYTDMSLILDTDIAVFYNYNEMLKILAETFTDDDLSDVCNDYHDFIIKTINEILNHIDENAMTDSDDIIQFVTSCENLNDQEYQFIIDCYYSTLRTYKISRFVDCEYQDEVCYEDYREAIAIDDYCKKYNCGINDIKVLQVFDPNDEYNSTDFHNYLKQNWIWDTDFVLDYDGLRTISDWLTYLIATLDELNRDLVTIDPTDPVIESNEYLISNLKSLQNKNI